MKFSIHILILLYVSLHCSFWMCWWNFDYLCFISTPIAIIKCIHINFSFLSTLIESNIWTLFYADFHFSDFLMLFDNLHITFRNSRKCPGYYEDFLWTLPIHFILTLADVDFLVFYVNLHITFRNSCMYPRYTILPCSRIV